MSSPVKSLTGKEICVLTGLKSEDTVLDVKKKIEAISGLPQNSLKICINGKFAKDDQSISCYRWKPGDPFVSVVTGVRSPTTAHESIIVPEPSGKPKSRQSLKYCGDQSCKIGYGYLQIDNYARKKAAEKTTGFKPGPKRWVSLPTVADVETFPCHNTTCTAKQVGSACLKVGGACVLKQGVYSARSESTDECTSTVAIDTDPLLASSGEQKKSVHFCDGRYEMQPIAANSTEKQAQPIAEKIYVDRDICGISLYQYAPNDAVQKEFASSEYGRLFLEEWSSVSTCNKIKQREAMACQEYKEEYEREEDALDDVLKKAGVPERQLQRTP